MPWDQLSIYINDLGCQVTTASSDGFCFLHAVEKGLYSDHDEVVTLDSMESTILDYLASNVKCYKLFHTGHALKDVQRYFRFGMYCDNVLDLIVVATARALKLNFIIYQTGPKGNI